MSSLFNRFKSSHLFLGWGLSFLFWLMYLPYLNILPGIAMDESAYAKTAYTFLHTGQFQHQLWVGSGKDFFLYPLVLSGAYGVLGCALWVSRFVSVILGWGTLLGFYQLLRNLNISKLLIFSMGLLVILNTTFYIIFRSCRPEALLLFLSMWTLVFFWKFISKKYGFLSIFMSALLSAAAVLAHPIGIFLWVALALFFVVSSFKSRTFKMLYPFILGSASIGLCWAWVTFGVHHQTLAGFLTKNGARGGHMAWAQFYANGYRFVATYTLGLKRGFILFFEILVLSMGVGYFRPNSSLKRESFFFYVSVFGFLFIGGGFLVITGFLTRYFAIVPLLVLIVLAGLLSKFFKDKKHVLAWGFVIFSVIYGLNNLAGQAFLWYTQHENTPYDVWVAEVVEVLPTGSKIATWNQFWFVAKDLHVVCPTSTDTDPQLFLPDYIVISPYLLDDFSPTTGGATHRRFITTTNHVFYKNLRPFFKDAICLKQIHTKGYGIISIYKVHHLVNRD